MLKKYFQANKYKHNAAQKLGLGLIFCAKYIAYIIFSTFLLNFERRIALETLASSRKFKVQLQGTPLDFRGY